MWAENKWSIVDVLSLMPILIRINIGHPIFIVVGVYLNNKCLIIIKFDNMKIKYDIFIKKCDNIYHNE